MSDIDTLKAEVKALNARATRLKMDLHDLSEDLPVGWERIPAVAAECHAAYEGLAAARARLRAAEG
ncbi:CCE_0567 family metalloprotein [Rhodocista pekingensis]|uniref:CCE_0567 family metalloprotein n=1 Tax=Rhodocista pekingensis TaxID=201185 RepID=A0ABW2KNY0_9PROT